MIKFTADSIINKHKIIAPWSLYEIDGKILDENTEYETELGTLLYAGGPGWEFKPFAGYGNIPPVDSISLDKLLLELDVMKVEKCSGFMFLSRHPRLFKLAITLYKMRERSA